MRFYRQVHIDLKEGVRLEGDLGTESTFERQALTCIQDGPSFTGQKSAYLAGDVGGRTVDGLVHAGTLHKPHSVSKIPSLPNERSVVPSGTTKQGTEIGLTTNFENS